ncbi:hypothetical protein [Paracoccus contaminans]|uniref:Uncharacterized protein n=1 Tax=Paracoccus contaminans TaxID=1945662 RepID=A0A1W6CW09_9RHOB|nr:hypothetical protein [Paracoccus contaminans]ARJ69047.1 hypothetical protein B0A89_04810 [Paracoccus contaminans]
MIRLAGLSLLVPAAAIAQAVNDYPTATRAEYVMTCMAVNGENPDTLARCSCAIDAIAAVLPHERYVAAETVLRMRQTSGERSGLFRSGAAADGPVADLRRAEAEAEVLCF